MLGAVVVVAVGAEPSAAAWVMVAPESVRSIRETAALRRSSVGGALRPADVETLDRVEVGGAVIATNDVHRASQRGHAAALFCYCYGVHRVVFLMGGW